jgi:cysteine desulfurase
MKLPIYLDHNATTPVDEIVLTEMLPYFSEIYGNAASVDHEFGFEGLQAVNKSRERIATFIGAKNPEEIIFTSGATESDNLAISGVAEKYMDKGRHIITSVTEHKAILDTCKHLEKKGWDISYLPVDQYGVIDIDEVQALIKKETVLISLMAANNEIGTLSPLKKIGKIAKENNVLFHTDATQALTYVPLDVQKMNIDLLSLSGHKIYGPKGVGALYVRNSNPRVKLIEQIHGGGHERGMRSGTLNVPGIVGLGKALELNTQSVKENYAKLKEMRDHLWAILSSSLDEIEINGHPELRLPHNLSIYIKGVETRSLIVLIKNDVSLSTGSACTTATVEPSHVILALGFGEERAYSSLRIGIGKNNTIEQLNFVADKIIKSVKKLRALSLV